MHRRALLAFAGASTLIATPVFAQRTSQSGASGQMTDAEMQHMENTMKTGALALATSRVAAKKAQNDMVKQFAEFEIAEQETMAEVLKSMKGQATTGSGSSGGSANESPEAKLDQNDQQMLQKMQSAKAGPEFDREYVKAQIDGHQKLLRFQEDYIKNGKMLEHVNVAKLARGQIKEHLTLLDNLSSQKKK